MKHYNKETNLDSIYNFDNYESFLGYIDDHIVKK